MPSGLGRNLRKGHLAEDIGINVLRAFSAVADVRHEDDVGVDAYCVLLRPARSLLLAEDVFSVQFKAASTRYRYIKYTGNSVSWFLNLQIPLFFGRVDASTGLVKFYTSTRYRQALFARGRRPISEIKLDFDSTSEACERKAVIVAGMDPPILVCNERESRTDEFAFHAYSLFQKWIAFERRSVDLQRLNIHIVAKWTPGAEPKEFFTGSDTKPDERLTHMRHALPVVEKLAYHAMGMTDCDPELLRAFIRVFRWFEQEGFEKDNLPVDILSTTAAR